MKLKDIFTEDPKNPGVKDYWKVPQESVTIPMAPATTTPAATPSPKLKDFLSEDLNAPKVQPTDRFVSNHITSPVVDEMFRLVDAGVEPMQAIKQLQDAPDTRVAYIEQVASEMVGRDMIKLLTLPDDYRSFRGPSWKKVKDNITESGGIYRDDEKDLYKEAVRKHARNSLSVGWINRAFDTSYHRVGEAFDPEDSTFDKMTDSAYEYVTPMLSPEMQKRFQIQDQIDAENAKSVEDGKDYNKIKALTQQLNSTGKTYTDMDGNVIETADMSKVSAEDKDFLKMIQDKESELEPIRTDRERLRDVFMEHYAYTRALEEIYQVEVAPKLGAATTFMHAGMSPAELPRDQIMTKENWDLMDKYREARAHLQAIGSMYMANRSPLDVKRDFGFFLGDAVESAGRGLFGDRIMNSIYDSLEKDGDTRSTTELRALSAVISSNELPTSEEMSKHLEPTFFEMANQTVFGVLGILPKLYIANVAGAGLAGQIGLMRYIDPVKGLWTTGTRFQQANAAIARIMFEEAKMRMVGLHAGSGAGFGLAHEAQMRINMPGVPAYLNTFMNFMKKPFLMTSSMYVAKMTEATFEYIMSDEEMSTILDRYYGGGFKELGATFAANMVLGIGSYGTPKNRYPELLKMAEQLEKDGNKAESMQIRSTIQLMQKMDKAEEAVKSEAKWRGWNEKETQAKLVETQRKVTSEHSASTTAMMERHNILERTIPEADLAKALSKTKMVDTEGKPQVWIYDTDAVFNLFDTRVAQKNSKTKKSAPGRAQGMVWFTLEPEFRMGANRHYRYLNFEKPKDVGNVRSFKFSADNIEALKRQGYDGITGYEWYTNSKGERVKAKVAASFGTQGIVKTREGSASAGAPEVLREWATKIREHKGFNDPKPGEIYLRLPYQEKVINGAMEAAAKTLEATASIVEAVNKAIEHVKSTDWYKSMAPEVQAKYDAEMAVRFKQLLEQQKPAEIAKSEMAKAEAMVKQAESEVMPAFKSTGEEVASKHRGEFVTDIKKPESIVEKRSRTGAWDVLDIEDVVRGALILRDMKDFKEASKDLKKMGYTIHNKRVGNSETGFKGVWATKREGELGTEIQIHTKETWEAHQKANALTKEFRGKQKGADIKAEESTVKIQEKKEVEKEFEAATPESFINMDTTPLKGTQYAVLTAENPGNQQASAKENAKKNKELMEELKKAGYKPIPVKGNYNGKSESSFIIPGMTEAEALAIGKKYGQESVITTKGMIFQDGTMHKAEPTINFDPNKEADYSIINLGGKEVKFSLEFDWINKIPTESYSSRYTAAMSESRSLYDKAYEGLELINLEGSPAKTALERKMKELELPVSTQREIKTSWNETKKKLLTDLREDNAAIKGAFNEFIKTLPLTEVHGLNIKLKPTMLRRVNAIDPMKPKSLERAIEYFDNIVNNAAARLNEIEIQKSWDYLDKKTSDMAIKQDNLIRGKFSSEGAPLIDVLTGIRKSMIEGNYYDAQQKIGEILLSADREGRPLSIGEYNQISELKFHGLLNETGGLTATAEYYKAAVADLKSIRTKGQHMIAAKRMVKQAQMNELFSEVKNILDGKPGKPVSYDQRVASNRTLSVGEKMSRMTDITYFDSWFTILDKLSKFDKSSQPYQSTLNKVYGGAVVESNMGYHIDSKAFHNETITTAKNIFNTKSTTALNRKLKEHSIKLYDISKEFQEVTGSKENLSITMNQAYKVWMDMQDRTNMRALENSGYFKNGEMTSLGHKIESILTPEVKQWAEWQLNVFYPKMYEYLNPSYREFYGIDMPFNEKYSPRFVQNPATKGIPEHELLASQTLMTSIKNNHLLTRTNHGHKLSFMDGDKVLTQYIDKMSYWKNWTPTIQLLNESFIRNGEIRMAIEQNFGPRYLKNIEGFMYDYSKKPKQDYTKFLAPFVNNMAVATLSLKIPVMLKQLTSAPAYLENMPVLEYGRYFSEIFSHPVETVKTMKRLLDSDYMQQRYKTGWDQTVTAVMARDLNSLSGQSNWRNWQNTMMFTVKYGDAGAILLGGFPLYRYEYEQAMKRLGPGSERMAEMIAINKFADATRNAQQAGEVYDLSNFQRDNTLTRALSMYRTAPMQYHRKVIGAYRNSLHGRMSWQDATKTIALYHVVLPSLFQLASNGFRWDNDDQLWAAVLGNFNNVLVYGDIVAGVTNAIRGLPWNYQMTPMQEIGLTAQDATRYFKKLNSPSGIDNYQMTPMQEIGLTAQDATRYFKKLNSPSGIDDLSKDVFEEAKNIDQVNLTKGLIEVSKLFGYLTGTPVPAIMSTGKGINDWLDNNTEYPLLRIMGWSESALKGDPSKFDTTEDLEVVRNLLDPSKPSMDQLQKIAPVTPALSPQQSVKLKDIIK